MKKRILFVDDEPNVLNGLRRMLRPMKDEWELEFAGGGEAALEIIGRAPPFDVVVSDMRMPGVDGSTLLEQVRKRSPRTVRLVLSGQSDSELTMKAVGPAHQFLSKPCKAETLIETVRRACDLREHMAASGLSDLVCQLNKLPSMPGIYRKLVGELQSPDPLISRVSAIIVQDPGMTAKVLQLVNSSFFSFQNHVTDPTQAVAILGTSTLRALVLTMHVFGQLENHLIEEFHAGAMQRHALATAQYARGIILEERRPAGMAEDAFLAGLLHDIGRLVLAANLPDQYRQVLHCARQLEAPLEEAETTVLGATHTEIGAYLLGLWGLPQSVVAAVSGHHDPAAFETGEGVTALTAVHVANCIEHERHGAPAVRQPAPNHAYLVAHGCAERLDRWRVVCREMQFEEVGT